MIRLLATFIIVGVLSVSLIVGTMAAFQDTETSVGNAVEAGTLDLKTADLSFVFVDGVSATWTLANGEPGVSTIGPTSIFLKNTGSVGPGTVDVVVSNADPDGLAPHMEVTSLSYTSGFTLGSFSNTNGTAFIDLDDLTDSFNIAVMTGLGAPAVNGGAGKTFDMALKFHASAPNIVQGKSMTTTVTFTLNQ